jgi:hypothetical protein
MRELKSGDKINAYGRDYVIAKIIYQYYYEDKGRLDVEFIDTRGGFHHIHQSDDGEDLIQRKTVWVVLKKWTEEKTMIDYTDVIGVYDSGIIAELVRDENMNNKYSPDSYDEEIGYDVYIEKHMLW